MMYPFLSAKYSYVIETINNIPLTLYVFKCHSVVFTLVNRVNGL